MSHYFALRRLLTAPATLLPAYVIVAPALVQERSSRRFLAGTDRQFTLQQSSDSQGAATLYANAVYIEGYGGYIPLDGYGEEFYFQGSRFVLSGFGNPDGADFDVFVDGVRVGTGSTYAPTDTQLTHFDSGVLPAGLHHVTTAKLPGRFAYFLDQLEVF